MYRRLALGALGWSLPDFHHATLRDMDDAARGLMESRGGTAKQEPMKPHELEALIEKYG